MNKLLYFSLTVLILNCPSIALSQSGSTAVGWRFGWTEGITIRHMVSNQNAIEGILGFRHRGYSATVLFEQFKGTKVPSLNLYYGLGLHVGRNADRYYFYNNGRYKYYAYEGESHFGPDFLLGLEYKIPSTPIGLSLDIKPTVCFYNSGRTEVYPDPGLGLKVIF